MSGWTGSLRHNAYVSMPETLGRLQRVRRIGAGGFASVWLYRDEQLDSYVAVKALADNWAQQLDIRDRFLEEARVLRRADSDHVVAVYDIGESADGTPYFVMTYADQGTVADLLREGSLDIATTVDLIEQACRGAADLHAAGVVHRDIKPPNLLLRSDRRRGRRLLVADLGLAKALMYASGLTQIVGTPAYMAPEQGIRSGGVDERADVHALGAVAYHLLAGRPMRDLPIADVGAADAPTPLRELTGAPAALSEAVARAVEPDPAGRWADPMTFAAALRAAAGEAASTVGPASSTATGTPADEPTRIDSGGTRIDRGGTRIDGTGGETAGSGARWRRLGAIGAAVAVVAAIAAAAWILGGNDPTADDGSTGDGGPSAPARNNYCALLQENWVELNTISETATEVADYEPAVVAIHEIREAAPAHIEGAWAGIDNPLQAFVEVLHETGTTWDDIDRGDIDSADQARITEGVARMKNEFSRFGAIAPFISRQARSDCGLNLGALSSR
jgi:eukaryotic-like serine/threonine-protein kinase